VPVTKSRELNQAPGNRNHGHDHHADRNHDHDNHHSSHQKHNHSSVSLLLRTVRIHPGLIPLGCSRHTFVGSAPILRTIPVAPVLAAPGYPDPGYYPPAPIYENAPRFGHGSSFPSQINYQVDPTSQLTTQEINFAKGSADIADDDSFLFLFSLAAALNSPDLLDDNFVIEGHASAEGSASYNQDLSQRRANSVFQFLVAQGVNPNRLLAVGHGELMAQYAANDPEHFRARDRRVMIFKLAQ
jgi:outer membrane protein OmpA-like peptidoglycan-associated protein